MDETELRQLLDDLRALPDETEWVEFKVSNFRPDDIGEYISALSNSASLHNHEQGYLVFGIEDKTHSVVGTAFRPKAEKKGNEELENWLSRLLNPRVDFRIHEFNYAGKSTVIIEIDAARDRPVKFQDEGFIRVGSYKKRLSEYPEKERKLWKGEPEYDWSGQICEGATVNDLHPDAIEKARAEYRQKHPHLAGNADGWDDITFLNKARLTINAKVTRAAIILSWEGGVGAFSFPIRC